MGNQTKALSAIKFLPKIFKKPLNSKHNVFSLFFDCLQIIENLLDLDVNLNSLFMLRCDENCNYFC